MKREEIVNYVARGLYEEQGNEIGFDSAGERQKNFWRHQASSLMEHFFYVIPPRPECYDSIIETFEDGCISRHEPALFSCDVSHPN